MQTPEMQGWLCVSNDGIVEADALRLMGASTKRAQAGKIGYFGTGFKYALAWFMRNGIGVEVVAGPRKIDIDSSVRELRGQSFHEILVDGRPTGITTDVGPKWSAWMALREVLCNAIDEGGMRVERTCTNDGTRTCVHIRSNAEIDACLTARYFRRAELGTREVVEETAKGCILPRLPGLRGTRVYRHGILVWEGPEDGSFDYEVDVSINEERMADGYEVRRKVMGVLDAATVKRKREAIFGNTPFEATCASWGGRCIDNPLSWREAVAGKVIATREEIAFHSSDPRIKAATVVDDAWATLLKGDSEIQTVNKLLKRSCDARGVIHPVDARWREVLPDAINISNKVLDACERPRVAPRDVVLVVEFADRAVRGKWSAAEGRIYVQYGLALAETVETLLHECAHRDSGEVDGTFGFEAELGRTVAKLAMKAFGPKGRRS